MDTIDIIDRAAELKNKAETLRAITNSFRNEFVEGDEETILFAIKTFHENYQALFRAITEYVFTVSNEAASFAADLEGCDFSK